MSSARLCSLVAELGYEGAGKLDPDSFEWPFQYDDARPILDWICSSLRPSNVLSLSELSLDATLVHKAEALELQRQLRRLQTQYDLLTGQSSALIQGRRARVAATSAVTVTDSLIGCFICAADGIYLAYSDFHAYLDGISGIYIADDFQSLHLI